MKKVWEKITSYLRRKVFRISADRWNYQYNTGRWNGLTSIGELPRTSVLAGYIRHLHKAGAVLDIGCGKGLLACMLGEEYCVSYTGVDISSEALKEPLVRNTERFRFIVENMDTYTAEKAYDSIVFNESLYYSKNPIATLNRFKTYLSKDGILLVSMVSKEKFESLWADIHKNFTIVAKITVQESTDISWIIAVLQ